MIGSALDFSPVDLAKIQKMYGCLDLDSRPPAIANIELGTEPAFQSIPSAILNPNSNMGPNIGDVLLPASPFAAFDTPTGIVPSPPLNGLPPFGLPQNFPLHRGNQRVGGGGSSDSNRLNGFNFRVPPPYPPHPPLITATTNGNKSGRRTFSSYPAGSIGSAQNILPPSIPSRSALPVAFQSPHQQQQHQNVGNSPLQQHPKQFGQQTFLTNANAKKEVRSLDSAVIPLQELTSLERRSDFNETTKSIEAESPEEVNIYTSLEYQQIHI